jgi:hypothetical protein
LKRLVLIDLWFSIGGVDKGWVHNYMYVLLTSLGGGGWNQSSRVLWRLVWMPVDCWTSIKKCVVAFIPLGDFLPCIYLFVDDTLEYLPILE